MRRRRFIHGIAACVAWPLAARAQQQVPVVGFLGNQSPEVYATRLRIFREGLKEAGYVEGENVAIEYRWTGGQSDLLPKLAGELIQLRVALLVVASGTAGAVAAKSATTTIPIVFGVAVDPVKAGLVASLNRPGGNLTGVTNLNVEIGPKRLELLHALLPPQPPSPCSSTRPVSFSLTTLRAACRRRPARSGCSSTCSMRVVSKISIRCLLPQPDCTRVRSSSAQEICFPLAANSLARWRPTTRCLRSAYGRSLLRAVAY